MNYSVYNADRTTHLRIVVVALVASIGLTLFALAARVDGDGKYASVVRVRPAQNVELSSGTPPPLAHRT